MKQYLYGLGWLVILSACFTACQKNPVQQKVQQEQQVEQNVQEDIQEGYFSYMADANMFISCDGKSKNSILMQGETYLELERQYLALKVSPQKVYLKMQAQLIDSLSEQKELQKPAWLIETMLELDKNKTCSQQSVD